MRPAAAYARQMMLERATQRESIRELFAVASERLRRLVSFQAATWMAADPSSGLPAGPVWLENLCADDHARVWELELLREEVNPYRDLARAHAPAAALRLATDDRPARSARYREILRPRGFDDELRAVTRADGMPWGALALLRARGMPAFDAHDVELVASLSEPLADAVRAHFRRPAPPSADVAPRGRGLMLFAPDRRLLSADDEARALLEELEPPRDDSGLPLPVAGALVRARAVDEERDHGPARVLTRSRAGHWLACHASCLRTADGRPASTALVLEPAQPAEIAPIMMAAYELTARERQVAVLVAHGFSTAGIAGRLHLSGHTVRDYVKAILAKVGAASRGELVARLAGVVL